MTDPLAIPGDNLPLPEGDLLHNVGKYLCLYEHEQRKRLILAQAYAEQKAEIAKLKMELFEIKNPDVVLGNP